MMAANIYDIGDVVRCTGTITASGTAVDPGTVLAKYRNPAGSVTTLTYGVDAALVKDAAGIYRFDISILTEGVYYYRIEGTGTNATAQEGSFLVRGSQLD